MKKLTLLTLTLVLTALAQLTAPPVQAEVSILDANLAAVIREALELPAGAAITADAMRNLTWLDASSRGIADLTGLEYAVNLTTLSLSQIYVDNGWHQNPISNLSPLASLTNLVELDLSFTGVRMFLRWQALQTWRRCFSAAPVFRMFLRWQALQTWRRCFSDTPQSQMCRPC